MKFSWLRVISIVLWTSTVIVILYILYSYLKRLRIGIHYEAKLSNTNITSLKFMRYSKLPKDINFFKRCLSNNDSVYRTRLPKLNLNDYDFNDVPIHSCIFTRDTVLPKDTEFFQKIYNKQITDCNLPCGDYSMYNFEGVYLNRVSFTKDSILPKNANFFKQLKYHNVNIEMSLPKNFSNDCHLYDFDNVNLISRRKIIVSDLQRTLMCMKNKEGDIDFIYVPSRLNKNIYSIRKRLYYYYKVVTKSF